MSFFEYLFLLKFRLNPILTSSALLIIDKLNVCVKYLKFEKH